MSHKFNPRKLHKLNDPERLAEIPPEFIWRRLALAECRLMVDLGAGTGLFSKAFLPLMDDGIIHAADTSQIMVDWLAKNVANEHPAIRPVLIEDSRLPLDDGVADLAISINVYHELDDPGGTLRELRRVLKPGGTVCIVDFKKEPTEHGPPVDKRFTAGEIADELARAGFTDIHTDESMESHSMVWGGRPRGMAATLPDQERASR